ncbi:quinone oxidoreductase [Legionella gratiana]|uniref:Quinone oxidoreductase n=1 Tax=Legionella gratiana TaxID=45066 RepID=A0A378JD28_9GAMM|nr:NAD(P)H-quinone oxidoreductase [Legionella gratiana]KTD09212.1 quinone oxidoreductase [Legionella gratiana]STX45535.1 quinone oxidoreductase [Legionella gratiana]
MRYVHIENPGPHSRLFIENGATPEYSDSQILVRVKATALNRADIMQRYGKYPPPPGESEIPGLEIAGDVIEVGAKVSHFRPGDKIYGLVGSGAYAEFCPVEASLAHHLPENWDYTLAAALPEALTTAYATLFDLGNFQSGQNLLIHGAGSGIASFTIQMAKLVHGNVITTVGTDDKVEKAVKLGANQVINYNKQDFEDLIEDHSIDLVIDFIGGEYFNKHLHLLKPKGKLIQIACLKGSAVECNLALIMRKRLEIIGFVLRAQSIEEKAKLWSDAHKMWITSLKIKQLTPIIDSTFNLEHIEEAHRYMQSSAHFGKIVVLID